MNKTKNTAAGLILGLLLFSSCSTFHRMTAEEAYNRGWIKVTLIKVDSVKRHVIHTYADEKGYFYKRALYKTADRPVIGRCYLISPASRRLEHYQ